MLNKVTKKKILFDAILVLVLLAISLSVYFFVFLGRDEGSVVRVSVNGEVVGEYPLYIDAEYTLNGGTNILTIENGTARMSYSDCPDHVCEITGKVRFVGETIVCLPNKLTVTVTGNSDDAIDFVS